MATVLGTPGDDTIEPAGSSPGVQGIVTDGADSISGDVGNDSIDGGAGGDTIFDGTFGQFDNGADTLLGGDGDDLILSYFGQDSIAGGAGADTIVVFGGVGPSANVFIVLQGADYVELAGRTVNLTNFDTDLTGVSVLSFNPVTSITLSGADPIRIPDSFDTWGLDNFFSTGVRLLGGSGDDNLDLRFTTLTLFSGGRAFYEAGGGNDTVVSTSGDALILDGGTGNDSLTGLGAADSLIGGSGNDTLVGGDGADTLSGGTGSDLYLVDNTGDRVLDRGPGADTVRAAVDFALGAGLEVLLLEGGARRGTGNSAANLLLGTDGDDILNGGGGADTMRGGAGNDLYHVDGAGDLIEDSAGLNSVVSGIDWVLATGFRALTLTGTADLDGTGNEVSNLLIGNAGANSLIGLGGDDTLDGKAGTDTMDGGLGNDRYMVDNPGDVLVDAGGVELVLASVGWTLATGFERLILLGNASLAGTGNAANNVITGNAGANSLAGVGGNDLLDGKGGTDTLDGGAGNDTFIVDNLGDLLSDASGTDLVRASVNWTLGTDFENLELLPGAVSGTGNTAANRITGNAALNSLSGGDGADTLLGMGGNDVLVGGAGNDLFVQLSRGQGTDEFSDFARGQDRFGLGSAAFGLPGGELAAANYRLTLGTPGSTTPSGTPQVIVVVPTGFGGVTREEVWFDPDGTGGAGPELLFANTSGTTLLLGREDFVVVA